MISLQACCSNKSFEQARKKKGQTEQKQKKKEKKGWNSEIRKEKK